MSPPPTVVLGVPIYGSGEHLDEALESLLAQTSDELAIVLCDDGPEGVRREAVEAAAGDRFSYHRNAQRLGLAGNWRRVFELARELHPNAEYFGWASDHDSLHPRCVELLREALERQPAAVLAYGRTYAFDANGHTVREVGGFETAGVADVRERLVRTIHGVTAGDMVYGLFRSDALSRAGILRQVLLPDRLLLTELSVHGDLVFVPRAVRYRRITAPMTLRRQRAAMFPDGAPLHTRLPWWLTHTGVLGRSLVFERAQPRLGRWAGARLVAAHARHSAWHATKRRVSRAAARLRRAA